MDYYLCVQVLLKRPICEQWPFPRCPNIKIAPQLLFAEPVTVRGAAAEPASCPGARCEGLRPPLTAPPAPPPPPPPPPTPAPLPTRPRHVRPGGGLGPAACGGQPFARAGRVSKARFSGSSVPTPHWSRHESRIEGPLEWLGKPDGTRVSRTSIRVDVILFCFLQMSPTSQVQIYQPCKI